MLFVQLTLNGIIAGSIYALVASGFALIYGTNKFMHFAHGVSVVVAGYILFLLSEKFEIPLYLSIVPTLVATSLFGLLLHKTIYYPLQKRNASNIVLLVAGISLLILFENLIQISLGSGVKSIKLGFDNIPVSVLGGVITLLQIIIFLISILIFLFLLYFMKKSKVGNMMRAVANNKELASIWGINSKKIAGLSFIIGSFIAGIAGVLIGMELSLSPTIGTNFLIKGFTGAVIGGIGNVPASILGSYFLGFAENYGIAFLPSGYKDAIGFVILIIFLLFKPNGLLGIGKGVKDNA